MTDLHEADRLAVISPDEIRTRRLYLETLRRTLEKPELPLLGMVQPVAHGGPLESAELARPWFYFGVRRWTRSRALLTAATWPGGA